MKKVVLSLAFVAIALVSCDKKADAEGAADSPVADSPVATETPAPVADSPVADSPVADSPAAAPAAH
jgi:hypothetical protein